MGRVWLKTVLCSIFCVWGVLCLGGCVEPIDLGAFVDDEEVQEIVQSQKVPGDLNVTVSYSFGVTEQTFTLTPNPLPPFSLDDIYDGGGSITVTLDNTGTIFNVASVKWTYSSEGAKIEWTGLSLEIDFDDSKYLGISGAGFYDIAVEAVRASDSLVYTSSLTLEITP